MQQQQILEEIKQKSLPVLKQAHVIKAALFGSYVRGDNTKESDIDMLIAFPSDATLIDFVRLKRALEENLKKKVDVVSYNGIYYMLKEEILSNQYPIL